ncbi:MAG: DUF6141 family protein [Caldisericia bacterium]|nr:DUF6141 family protein [Caldisericia bacterium]
MKRIFSLQTNTDKIVVFIVHAIEFSVGAYEHQKEDGMEDSLVEYEERQAMNQWWVWALVLLTTFFAWYTAYIQLVKGVPVGTNPASDSGVIILWIGMGILFPLFMVTSDLQTFISEQGIRLSSTNRFFIRRFIPFSDIQKAEAKIINPLFEYGGWGNRGIGKRKAYIMHGNTGVMLTLKNGATLFIGSDSPEELLSVIQSHLS